MNNVTTTRGGFRVEDITFHNARQQSEILKEGVTIDEEAEKTKVEIPKSLTQEQLKTFYLKKIQNTRDEDEKRVYAKTIHLIDELAETKKELVQYKLKEMQLQNSGDTPDDIE